MPAKLLVMQKELPRKEMLSIALKEERMIVIEIFLFHLPDFEIEAFEGRLMCIIRGFFPFKRKCK